MAIEVSDILAGPVQVYYSAYGTTVPAETVAVGGSWPVGWTALGATKGPLKLIYTFEKLNYIIEEALGPVKRRKISEDLRLEVVLAELSGTTLNLAWDGELSQTAQGSGVVGRDDFYMGDYAVLTERQWGFEGNYIDEDGSAHPHRLFLWKGTAEAGGTLEFMKKDYTGLTLAIGGLIDLTKAAKRRYFQWQKVTEEAL